MRQYVHEIWKFLFTYFSIFFSRTCKYVSRFGLFSVFFSFCILTQFTIFLSYFTTFSQQYKIMSLNFCVLFFSFIYFIGIWNFILLICTQSRTVSIRFVLVCCRRCIETCGFDRRKQNLKPETNDKYSLFWHSIKFPHINCTFSIFIDYHISLHRVRCVVNVCLSVCAYYSTVCIYLFTYWLWSNLSSSFSSFFLSSFILGEWTHTSAICINMHKRIHTRAARTHIQWASQSQRLCVQSAFDEQSKSQQSFTHIVAWTLSNKFDIFFSVFFIFDYLVGTWCDWHTETTGCVMWFN